MQPLRQAIEDAPPNLRSTTLARSFAVALRADPPTSRPIRNTWKASANDPNHSGHRPLGRLSAKIRSSPRLGQGSVSKVSGPFWTFEPAVTEAVLLLTRYGGTRNAGVKLELLARKALRIDFSLADDSVRISANTVTCRCRWRTPAWCACPNAIRKARC